MSPPGSVNGLMPDWAQERRRFLTTLQFYTRIPVCWRKEEPEDLGASSRYLPVVGWLVGGLSGVVALLTSEVWGVPVGVLLGVTVGVMLTGALHEDGFADLCDGFGGGWSRENILRIMKDSRLGTFGVLGLLLLLGLKVSSLVALMPSGGIAVWIAAHAWSRFLAIETASRLPYVQDPGVSRSGALQPLDGIGWSIAALSGGLPLLLLGGVAAGVVMGTLLLRWGMELQFRKKLGGVTGDCLGGVQQVAEVTTYLIVLGAA